MIKRYIKMDPSSDLKHKNLNDKRSYYDRYLIASNL